eukprot:TRINITY_DN4000_c0_g1_i1.p1 TRINITY_DN4000_c0_g1~~TRINITY_DN4000_c0_g1_i1.p1  ORF type:complete len:699 (-),score=344.54 TRINITY_DN4000_c0_g1_i1:232-2328(-)
MSDLEINGTPIAKLRVVDLKNELDARGLSKSGKKDELIARLMSHMEAEETSEEAEKAETAESEVIDKTEGAGDSEKETAEAIKEQEEKLSKEAKVESAKKEEERLAEEAKIQKEKQAMEEEKRLKEAKEEEERQRKIDEKKKAEEELKLKEEEKARKEKKEQKMLEEEEKQKKAEKERKLKEEERKRKDEEERQRLKMEEKQIEEEKKKKDEERKRIKEDAKQKKMEESENQKKEEAEQKKIEDGERKLKEEEKEKIKADQRSKDEKASADRKIKWEKEQEDRQVKDEKLKMEKEKQREEAAKEKDISDDDAKPDSNKAEPDNGLNGKEDESLIIETAADDTLVMEIDQADMVAEEVSKEEPESPMISAEPGQVTSLRRLGGSKSGLDASRKRGWGASKGSTASANSVSISSNSLKDLVPDIKPLLDTEATIEEEVEEGSVDSDADIAGPKIPDNVKKDAEPVKKRKKIPVTDLNETAVVLIINLTRPFTVNQLKEMLKRTGTIVDFWIDRIKSMCCVQFSTVDQASETRMALDGVTWPQGNPKTLRVSFSTEEELKKHQESSSDALSRLGGDSNGRLGGVREWDKNKLDQEQERAKEREKRLVREKERREGSGRDVQEREKSVEKKPAAVKSLEDLFKKTVAGPAIYWKPLSEDQIKQKIEARNKKIMEAQIMREMMDTKESLQRSKKLLPARSPHD